MSNVNYPSLRPPIMTTCAILQSNYIPWKGYFELIEKSDIFVFHDDLQYTKRDWRNRNRILTPSGPVWLSIPVGSSEKRTIDQVLLPSDSSWRNEHVSKIRQYYSRTEFFQVLETLLFPIITDSQITNLSSLNRKIIMKICEYLEIGADFVDVRDLGVSGDRVEKLIQICTKLGSDKYLSGPAAKSYINDEFDSTEITIEWMEYGPYPEYNQFTAEFYNEVSIIDLIANTGPEASQYFSRKI